MHYANFINFGKDIESIANLRIFTGERTLLASGEAEVEENLQVKGAATVNLAGGSSLNDVCWTGNMDAAQLVACSQGADLAEYYEAEGEVEEGDVVSIGSQVSEEPGKKDTLSAMFNKKLFRLFDCLAMFLDAT